MSDDKLRAENERLASRLAAVEAIHHPATHHAYPEGWCPSCDVRWPCRTGRALTAPPRVEEKGR